MSIIVSWRELLLSAVQKCQLFAATVIILVDISSLQGLEPGRPGVSTPLPFHQVGSITCWVAVNRTQVLCLRCRSARGKLPALPESYL